MIGIGNGLMFGGMRPLASLVSSILRAFTGSLYLPSPTSCFQDVAGTTPCTVDTSVALMLDEMRTLGSELVTNGDFSAGTTGWSGALGGVLSSASGVLTVTQGLANYGQARQTISCVVGGTYKFSWVATNGTASAFVIQIDGATKSTIAGVGEVYFVATSTTPQLVLAHNNTNAIGTTLLFDNISVREVTGIHATQATAGFRPVLRGKVKNLLLQSGDLSNGAWNKVGATGTTSTELKEDSTAASLHCVVQYSKWDATQRVAQFKVKAGSVSGNKVAIINASASVALCFDLSTGTIEGIIGSISGAISLQSDGYYLITATHTAAGAQTFGIAMYHTFVAGNFNSTLVYNGDGVSTLLYQPSAQLELGTVANPYVATGATVASSSYGPYWLDFDGIDDRMQLSAVPFQMTDDSFVVAGTTPLSTATMNAISITHTTLANPWIALRGSGNAQLYAMYRDDAGVMDNFGGSGGVTYTLGNPHVSALKKIVNNKTVYTDVVYVGTGTAVMGATTFDQAHIGCRKTGVTSEYFSGPIYSIALGKGAITDSQLLTIERYVGQKTGVTI